MTMMVRSMMNMATMIMTTAIRLANDRDDDEDGKGDDDYDDDNYVD